MTDWLQAQEVRQAQELARLRATMAYLQASIPIADSPANAPGWVFEGIEYTCIPDAVYPWSPEIVRAIWEFAPDARPLWSRWIYRTPEDRSLVVYGRHAIGRYEPNPRLVKAKFRVSMPSMPCQGLTFNAPNVVEWTFKGVSEDSRPGPYVPFDYDVVDFLRSTVPAWHKAEAVDLSVTQPELRRLRAEVQREDQERVQREDVDRYVDAKLAQTSELQQKEWALFRHLRGRERKVFV